MKKKVLNILLILTVVFCLAGYECLAAEAVEMEETEEIAETESAVGDNAEADATTERALQESSATEPSANQDAPADADGTYNETWDGVTEVVTRYSDGVPGRGSIEDLESYWNENGYPEDVSYAFEAGGEVIGEEVFSWWEIGLVDADEARKQEILDLIAPNCLVTFKSAMFNHAEKQEAYWKLVSLAETDKNIRQVVISRNTDVVVVSIADGLEKEYAELLVREHGLGAVVSVVDSHGIVNQLEGIDDVVPGGDVIDNGSTMGSMVTEGITEGINHGNALSGDEGGVITEGINPGNTLPGNGGGSLGIGGKDTAVGQPGESSGMAGEVPETDQYVTGIAVAATLAATGFVLLYFYYRQQKSVRVARQTVPKKSDRKTETERKDRQKVFTKMSVTRKQTVETIRSDEERPGEELFSRIWEQIEKEEKHRE